MTRCLRIMAQILFVLIVSFGCDNTLHCQDELKGTVSVNIADLPQGCKLVLDPRIDTTDSLSTEIINGVREIIPRIQKLILSDSVSIYLVISSENVLPQFGMGGSSSNDRVNFFIDPKNPNFRVEFMVHSLVHEFFHVIRLRMPQWRLTMLECMITEGLADHFMIEVTNCEIPKWSQAITEDEIQQYMKKAKPILYVKHESWNSEFNEKYFAPWMFGRSGDDPIPGWTGYSLGWRIVENYLKAHPESRASSLVFTPAELIAASTPALIESK